MLKSVGYHKQYNNLTYLKLMDYLYQTYIRDFRRRFVKGYTNKVLHFNTIVTFCDKDAHAILKR